MGANVDAGEFAGKLSGIVREIQRNRMGRPVNQPKQNVAGSQEIQLAGFNNKTVNPPQNG
jgi:hypothetical protein